MITNTASRAFDVIEITNEMPLNRIGGVGSVIEHLERGLDALGIATLWFVVDHRYHRFEYEELLNRHASIAIGEYDELSAFDATVVHLHSYVYRDALLDYLAPRRTIFTIHSLLVAEERSNDVDLGIAVQGQERLIEACNEVAVVSEAERALYLELGYGRLNPAVSVIYNGIGRPASWRPRTDRRVLGYCGRLVPRKRPEYSQMILCEPEFSECRTLIAGKAFSAYACNLVSHLGLDDRVDYLGWCAGPRLEAFYDSIDVLVMASVYEPFGLAALEAIARGIPVVCTRVGGLSELLGEHAFYAESDSYPDVRDALRRWIRAEAGELLELESRARARFLDRFTDQHMAEAYRERFAALTETSTRRAASVP